MYLILILFFVSLLELLLAKIFLVISPKNYFKSIVLKLILIVAIITLAKQMDFVKAQ
jgi:hypothetical protein